MVDSISLAGSVAARIGKGAEVSLSPEYTLKDVKDRTRIVVVPVGVEHKMVARARREDEHVVDVGVLRKATEDDLVGLVAETEKLALSLLHAEVGGARCVKVLHQPLYDPEHLRERRQFTGVIRLHLREMNLHDTRD